MRKYLILFLLLYAKIALAQIQVLPDLEVTGESQTRIFLYKKALPYSPASTLADSLSPYLPLELPPLKLNQPQETKPHLKHYFQAYASSSERAGLFYRFYQRSSSLRSLGLNADYSSPAAEYRMQRFAAVADIDFNKYLQLRARGSYQENESPKLISDLKSGQVSILTDAFALGESEISESTNLLKYTEYIQDDRGYNTRIKHLFWQHEHRMELGKYALQNSLYLSGDNTVIMAHLKSPDYFFEDSGIFVLFNKKHLIPGFSFHSSYSLDFNKSISLGNYPKVIAQDYDSILQEYPYIDATQKMRHSLLPLNFRLVYEQELPETKLLGFTGFSISNYALYYCDQPKLRKQESKLVALAFQDVLENNTSLKLSFQKGDFNWEQSFALALGWLSNQNWQIKPYSAPFIIQSDLAYSIAKWQANLAYHQGLQAYIPAKDSDAGKDEYYSYFDLDLGIGYQVAPAGLIYLKGLNLLNLPHIIHKELPAAGRELLLGLNFFF